MAPHDTATGPPSLLSTRGLTRRHPDGEGFLLDGIDLTLAAGERLALQGPSGSGKSLLLRALAGLDPIDSGSLCWRGEAIAPGRLPALRADAIYLHQQPFLEAGSVAENLRMPLAFRRHSERRFDRAEALRLLAAAGRDESFLDRHSDVLSGGEAQIVCLLRALLLAPSALLLDEPTAALDPAAVEALEALVESWRGEDRERRAYLWVTHDDAQARRVADRRLRIERGRLVASAAGAEGSP